MQIDKFMIPAALAALLLVIPACEKRQEQETTSKPAAVSESRPTPQVMTIKGKVLEILDGGNFIFIRLDTDGKQTWATAPSVDLAIGEQITLLNATAFKNFHSNSLDRSFEELIFSSGIEGKIARRKTVVAADGQGLAGRRSQRLLGLKPKLPVPEKEQDQAPPATPSK